MSRLPNGVTASDEVLTSHVEWGAEYHRAAGPATGCELPLSLVPHRVAAGHMAVMCGSPCPRCWPDLHGLDMFNQQPYLSPAGVRDRKPSGAASVCGPAWTRATTTP